MACVGLVTSLSAFADFQVVNLLTEYTSCPMGLDEARPRFSWQMRSEERGAAQAAYRLTLTDEQGQTVWDSGRRTSSTCCSSCLSASSTRSSGGRRPGGGRR